MYFLSALCAGKNSKLLIHTEANISKSRANWFRYHSLKLANWLRKYSVKVGLFPFLFLFPEKASWALWRNSSDFWSSSDIMEPVIYWLQLLRAYVLPSQLCPHLEKSVKSKYAWAPTSWIVVVIGDQIMNDWCLDEQRCSRIVSLSQGPVPMFAFAFPVGCSISFFFFEVTGVVWSNTGYILNNVYESSD